MCLIIFFFLFNFRGKNGIIQQEMYMYTINKWRKNIILIQFFSFELSVGTLWSCDDMFIVFAPSYKYRFCIVLYTGLVYYFLIRLYDNLLLYENIMISLLNSYYPYINMLLYFSLCVLFNTMLLVGKYLKELNKR
jgi:hypothetical protein